jgi:ornithine cyclodeaminase/alanine dehydrogenase-like protein (mu-crystallin family)
VLAAETLGREGASSAAVIGAGVNGRAAARTFLARGRSVAIWDVDGERASAAAAELGAEVADSFASALGADLVVTVTPGRVVVLEPGTLRTGQHVSLMGADGPGKAEAATEVLAGAGSRLFCDDWEQASHGGEIAHAVEEGAVRRADVTELGGVLAGSADGRRDDDEITLFDSTGLAIQDLAIAIAALEQARSLGDLPRVAL